MGSERKRPPSWAARKADQKYTYNISNYNNIPAELKVMPQWVIANHQKIPFNPKNMRHASTTDPKTWGTFEEVVKYGGEIGRVFTKDDPYVGIDLDPKSPEQEEHCRQIVEAFNSYTETSRSGNGAHIIVRGEIPHAVKRDHVEIYDTERYFIFTGNRVNDNDIVNRQELLDALVNQMGRASRRSVSYSEPEKHTDRQVYDLCASYRNGDHFLELWNGYWKHCGRYPSQSEADFALMNKLAFVSRNNEQCMRLFRTSALGQRQKAQRDDYLERMLGTIRAEQHPPIDFSNFQPPPVITEHEPIKSNYEFPGGLVGEMAQYILDTAIKPIPQVALAGALGLMSGIAGRTYNISNTGLNLYYLVIAGTAIGKEGASQGMDRIITAVGKKLPAVHQYIGPGEYASGQALVKQLENTPCMVSKMGEFGHMLKRICNPNAIGADIMWRKLFLELFNKSGPTDKLGRMVYSDQGKNTVEVSSPAFSIVADSTASSVFENLSEETIEIGLIPRFMIIECPDKRPHTNPNAWAPPSVELTAKVEQLAVRCLSMGANSTRQPITVEKEARRMLKDFDEEIDGHINAQNDDAVRQIWSRSYLKAARVAGLLAVGMNIDNPSVRVQEAQWAIDFARKDAQHMLKRFGDGVGGGDPEQIARLRTIIINTLKAPKSPRKMTQSGVVSHQLVSQRAYALACFKKDRIGAGNALKRALQALMDNGELIELSAKDRKEQFNTYAKCYLVTKGFQRR